MAAWPISFVDRGQNRFERLLGTVGKATNVRPVVKTQTCLSTSTSVSGRLRLSLN
jgi:hypothetical protein